MSGQDVVEIGSAEEGATRRWPVDWGPAVRELVGRGEDPSVLLDEPWLAAHRVLDRLAALAHDVRDGVEGGQAAFEAAVDDLVTGAPWLTESAPRSTSAEPAYYERGGVRLVDESGVLPLVATAVAVGGQAAASAIRELAVTAMAAERWRGDESGLRADVARVSGMPASAPDWERLRSARAGAQTLGNAGEMHRCAELVDELMRGQEGLRPELNGPLTWVSGISALEVSDPCSASPTLVVRGSGFGATQPPGVAVVVPVWRAATRDVEYTIARVTSWTNQQITLQIGGDVVGGVVAFVNADYVRAYNDWNRESSRSVASAMRAAGCPGFGLPMAHLWPPLRLDPPADATVTFEVGAPRIVVEVTGDPLGTPATPWGGAHAQVQSGSAFWIVWHSRNADDVAVRPVDAVGIDVLQASGQPASGVSGLSGSIRLVAPARAAVLSFVVEGRNATCGTVQSRMRIVVTGRAIGPVRMTVLQALPGGDVDVVDSSGVETFAPAGGRSIALVAEKRTVVRIDWWPAIPQVPEGERVDAVATLDVRNQEAWPELSGLLRPPVSTADDPPVSGVTLPAGRPFESLSQYDQWVADGNQPATFNVVLPAEWCKWEAILEAKVRVFSPGPMWEVSTALWVKFHRRRRVRIRYRRYTRAATPATPTTPAVPAATATTEEAVAAIRRAASMLPIPDPEIVVLGNDPAAPTTAGYIEDMMVERGGTPTPAWRDEIWLVVGPAGDGGVASPTAWPWTGAAGATGEIVAHEIGHMFNQAHIALCGAAQNPEQPSAFPDMGNVVPVGWDVRNNREVRNAIDVMSYCGNRWISPERWRRIFLQVGPP